MKTVLMCGPFNTRSGYGDHARSIFYALHDLGKYDIKLWDVRWGDTPRNFLKESNSRHKLLLDRLLREPTMDSQPDIYVDVRIPNEFETFGKVNIGVTAGIETTVVSSKWIEGCNKMDLIIVPSEHSKLSFINSIYDKVESLPDGTQRNAGRYSVEKPIEVIFEGAEEDIYKPLKVNELDNHILNLVNDVAHEKFAFLFVGQWCKGGYGEDRKDVAKLIKIFYESFANTKSQPALILKTSGAGFSLLDKIDCLNKIQSIKAQFPSDWSLPNVYLLHGDLTDEEMNSLYNHPKIKCLVSFTHGEGFGRPLLEATMVGLPVICSNWSGPVDFLDENYNVLVEGSLNTVPESVVWEDIIVKDSKWFTVDEHAAHDSLSRAYDNHYNFKEKAKSLMRKNREKFTMSKMTELIDSTIEKYTKSLPTQSVLNLPKLKKVSSKSDENKLKLPKLKKVS